MRNALRLVVLATLGGWLLTAQAVNNKLPAGLLQQAHSAPVRVLVEMTDKADLSAAYGIRDKDAKGAFVMHALQQQAARSQADLASVLAQYQVEYRSYWIANVVLLQADATLLTAIAALPSVALIHPMPEMTISKSPMPLPSVQSKADEVTVEPGLILVGANKVWDLGIRGQGAVVGDHDIGVQWQHPALKNQYRGWDGVDADHAYNWRNAFGSLDAFCTDPVEPCDSNGHGTHTTGTMVGDDGAGMQIGMAPEAQWIGCRSLLDPVVGLGTLPTYLDCMEWFVAPYPEGAPDMADPTKAPDVINNSWGCAEACPPNILQAADEATKAAGIVQVGSAGNEGNGDSLASCSTIIFPLAIYDTTFTVGASDFDDQMASFSSRGPVLSDLSMRIKPNIVAPGVGVNSSDLDGSYGTKSGTSMAAPHVSGLVALMISAVPELRGQVDAIRRIIQDTAVPLDTSEACGDVAATDLPNNVFGFGRIDAYQAVLAAQAEFGSAAGGNGGGGDTDGGADGGNAGASTTELTRGSGSVPSVLLLCLVALAWRRCVSRAGR